MAALGCERPVSKADPGPVRRSSGYRYKPEHHMGRTDFIMACALIMACTILAGPRVSGRLGSRSKDGDVTKE